MNSSNRSAISGWSRFAFGQRADAGRIIDDEDRSHQVVLDLLFEDLILDHVGVMIARGLEPSFWAKPTTAASSDGSTPVCSRNRSS